MNPRDYGVHIFHGTPGCGKTEGALALTLRIRKTSPPPAMVIIDPQRAYNFVNIAEVSAGKLWEEVYTKRLVRKFTPRNVEEFEWAMRGLRQSGTDTLVLIDEVRHYASSNWISAELVTACREYRHSRLGLYLTTQRLGDLRDEVMSCWTRIYNYRTDSPRSLDKIEREYGIPRERILALGVGQCIIKSGGFDNVTIPK